MLIIKRFSNLVLLLLLSLSGFSQEANRNTYHLKTGDVEIVRNIRAHVDIEDSLQIYFESKLVFELVKFRIYLKGGKETDTVFTDINNNGIPDLIIRTWSGGRHCCRSLKVIEFKANGPRIICDEPERDTHYIFQKDEFNNQNVLIFRDDSFDYWKTGYAVSPKFIVVKTWNPTKNKYTYANPGILDRSNDGIDMLEWVDRILYNPHWFTGEDCSHQIQFLYDYWGVILAFLAKGKTKLAREFSIKAWNASEQDRISFMNEFMDQLETSDHYPYILDINPDLQSLRE